ncbi:MAG TPA: SdrD B-like domain-containing protein, partial [Pyrinomonadaceae bacterium]|nr:SdrD B-like domain-containing protein [Pyrinomonadaceae bacterium]
MQTNKFKILLWIFAPCAALFAISFFLFSDNLKTHATGTISGRVFQDYNSNGNYDTSGTSPNLAIDTGIAAVMITVYDSAGNARGTTVSAANGTYSLVATGTGPYRVEFTNLPSGYSPSARSTDSVAGGTATNSGSTVQFLSDGNSSNVNLALNRPTDYAQNNLQVVASQFTRENNNGDSVVRFPYSLSSNNNGNLGSPWAGSNIFGAFAPSRGGNEPLRIAETNTIGNVNSLIWDRLSKKLYASSYIKRRAKLGTLGNESSGAIYVINNPASASPTASVFVDLNTVFGAGTTGINPHPISTTNWLQDNGTISIVGKTGLGDIELSQDGSILYAVNMQNRKLYLIPTAGALNSTTITSFDIPNNGLSTSSGNCSSADVRPFGLGKDAVGGIYVGAVCSAESTGNAAQTHAYIWRFDNPGFTLVANNTLSYTRSTNTTVNWHPWSNIDNVGTNAEPVLTDIDFDISGAMLVGLRDRHGDKSPKADGPLEDTFPPRTSGTTLRACPSGSVWTFESNGSCGGVTTTGAGNTRGIGGGQFYHQQRIGDGTNDGSSMGMLLQVPGYDHVLATAFDAAFIGTYVDFFGNTINVNTDQNVYTGGVQRYKHSDGTTNGAYDIYLRNEANSFAKINGIGDIEVLADAAPIEIGNRVWRDTDGDGVQDPGESPIAGVTVHLYDSNNVLIATAVTDANGEYYFTSGSAADGNTTDNIGIVNGQITPNTNYQIRFDNPADYTSGGPLFALFLSPANSTFQNGDDDSSDSDAVNVTNPSGSPAGAFPVISVTTGGAGQNNHTLDVGFNLSPTAASVSVGGRIQASDGRGIRNVIISLTTANGTTRFARSGSFGYYNFDEVESGQTITVSVQSKRFTFSQSTIAFSLEDAVDDLIFTADLPTLPSSPVKAEAIRNNQIV